MHKAFWEQNQAVQLKKTSAVVAQSNSHGSGAELRSAVILFLSRVVAFPAVMKQQICDMNIQQMVGMRRNEV